MDDCYITKMFKLYKPIANVAAYQVMHLYSPLKNCILHTAILQVNLLGCG